MIEYVELILKLLEISVVRAILCIIGSILAAKLVDWIIGRILSRLVNRTRSTVDDKIIQILHRPIYYSILFMGLLFLSSFSRCRMELPMYSRDYLKPLL